MNYLSQSINENLFQSIAEVVRLLGGIAREWLPAKASSDKGLTAGDFSTWYFEACWPVIVEARNAEEAARAVAACRYPPSGFRSSGPVRAMPVSK